MGFMEIVLPLVVSFVITAAAGRLLIPALRRLKAGQSIKEIGPTWHMTKQGTPTMGGVMFIIGIGITILALGWRHMMAGEFAHLYVYLFALVFGAIGFIDDYQKVKHHHNTGLTALQKFALQLAAMVMTFAFPLMARYENTWRNHLKNAMLVAVGHLPRMLLIWAVWAVPVGVSVFIPEVGFYLSIVWVLIGYSSLSYVTALLLRPVFRNLDENA